MTHLLVARARKLGQQGAPPPQLLALDKPPRHRDVRDLRRRRLGRLGRSARSGWFAARLNHTAVYRTLPLPPRLPLGVFFLLSPGAGIFFYIKPRWAAVF
jgi:hypothetical protein